MRTCRSPVEFGPPSIGGLSGIGYGPESLSSAYRNATGFSGWFAGTTTYGMPIGPPFQNVPKSGWRNRVAPMKLTYVAELACTGYPEMSVFHGLSGGKIVQAAEPGVGVAVGAVVGVRVGVRVAVAVGAAVDVGSGVTVAGGASVGVRVGVAVLVGTRVFVGLRAAIASEGNPA